MDTLWTPNPALADASRWWRTSNQNRTTTGTDLAILAILGAVAAAASSAGNLGIPLPGHVILRGTLPLVLGISLVPRHGSGSIMSAAAAVTFVVLSILRLGPANPAAMTGLLCLGPALDIALSQARPGWRLYARAATAGLAANLLAFAVRMGSAAWLGDALAGGGFLSFWPVALLSFVVFGALAGLLSAAASFRSVPRV